MRGSFSEADWKYFRKLRTFALDRFCQRVLKELSQLLADNSPGYHDRYLAVYRLICDRDQELGETFEPQRRSMAIFHLARMFGSGLITDEEFAGFSDAARNTVREILQC